MFQGKTVPWDPAFAQVGRDELYLQAEESECIFPEKLSQPLVGTQLSVAEATRCHAKVVGVWCCDAPDHSGCRAPEREPASPGRTLRQARPVAPPRPPSGALWAAPRTALSLLERSCPLTSTLLARPRASPRGHSGGRREP